MEGEVVTLDQWPGAQCSREFCVVTLHRGGREWRLLIARGKDMVEAQALAAACERVDIVIADRRLPWSCKPVALKADRVLLGQTGGLALNLADGQLDTVAQTQGEHGWWVPAKPYVWKPAKAAAPQPAPLMVPPSKLGGTAPDQ